MVGWDELVVDDRTEERRSGRHTRSKSLFSSSSTPLYALSNPPLEIFLRILNRMERLYSPSRFHPWVIQNLQNMMGSIGEPGQAGDDVGGRKK